MLATERPAQSARRYRTRPRRGSMTGSGTSPLVAANRRAQRSPQYQRLGALGPVDKPRPDTDTSEQDESHKAGGELIISGGDAPLLLEMANEALNPRPQRIERFVDRVLHLAVSLGRDLGCRAAIPQVMADRIAVVAFVRQHGAGIAVALLHQLSISRHVMGLALAEYDPDGESRGVATQMDLGAEPTARAAKRLILLLSHFARCVAMRSYDGAVDHLQHVHCAAAVSQRLKQQVPDASLAPATELLPHGVPFAERRRQVAPRRSGPADPKYAVQPVPMVLGWTPATRGGGGQEGREDRPLFVRHQSADHGRPRVYQEAGQD